MDPERTEAELDPAEHIHPDDPRYNGFRIRELWIATAIAPDNQEAMLYIDVPEAVAFHVSPGPAFASDERRLNHIRAFAQAKATELGIEVQIRHFVPAGSAEDIRR
jgi:hypothetical protein